MISTGDMGYTKKGFSGATIERAQYNGRWCIRKEHPCLDIGTQIAACKFLYPITPFVHYAEPNNRAYVMEELSEPPEMSTAVALKMFEEARQLLTKMAWTSYIPTKSHDWRGNLCAFIKEVKNMSGIEEMLDKLYPRDVPQPAELTHGDPTLSNMMYRGRQLCIIDPLPSIKIADDWTADVGKMMQSAIGWEIVTCNWRYNIKDCVEHLLIRRSSTDILRIWFWCMVHCVRIIPYTARASRESKWARHCASILHIKLETTLRVNSKHKEDPTCITLSILTEL